MTSTSLPQRSPRAGKRKLPLPAPVAAALLAFQTCRADEKQAAGQAYSESGYVLVDEVGAVPHGLAAAAGVQADGRGVGSAGTSVRRQLLELLAHGGCARADRVGMGRPR